MQLAFLAFVLLFTPIAHQTGYGFDDQAVAPTEQAPAAPQPIPKGPPPPLFPKHRRGLYRNGQGLEVLDATPQSPPLETDDPGVPEKGEYEVNLTVHGDLSRLAKQFDLLLVDANYGLLPRLRGREIPTQLKFEIPVAGAIDSDHAFTAGIGAATVGLKFNFFNSEHHATQLSFYPQLEFAVGVSPIEKGLAEPGQTLTFPLLVSKILGYVTLTANAAVNKPIHDSDRRTTGTFAIAGGLAVTRKFAAMAELHSDSRFDLAHDRLLTANIGLMRSLGGSIVLYTNAGRSLFSEAGETHTYVGVGLKLLMRPGGRTAR